MNWLRLALIWLGELQENRARRQTRALLDRTAAWCCWPPLPARNEEVFDVAADEAVANGHTLNEYLECKGCGLSAREIALARFTHCRPRPPAMPMPGPGRKVRQ